MSQRSASSEQTPGLDVTEPGRTKSALPESERRLATLLANLPGMAYRCRNDAHWTMEFVSEGCFRLTGYQPSELVGNRLIGYNDIVHPEDRSTVRVEVLLGIAHRRQFQLTYRIQTAQGEQKWVWEQGVAILSDDGQVASLEGFITDITERKRAEAKLRLSHEQLEQRVRDRTAELQTIYDALRTEKETLRRLLLASDHERRVIAYEIHDTVAQQLAGAALHLEACLKTKEAHSDRAAEAFDAGLHALRECQADVRRLIAGVRPMNLDETGVEAAIRYLIRSLEGEPGPAVEFHCEVQFKRLESIQENAICRIVQEGLRNARRHSRSPSVRIELRQQADWIRLVVQDWGRGFDPADIGEYHFGLDAIRERARLLGGHAQIESAPGNGTCITVDLPLLARDDDE